jgi:parallel beta-helix repeat protein
MRVRWLLGAVGVLATLVAGGSASAATSAPECKVPKKYATIQQALDDPACLIIRVAEGHYSEQLTVRRSLTLIGSGERYTTLHAPASMSDPKAIIRVTGRKVKFKMKHIALEGPGTGAALVGVRLEKDTMGTLTNVIISDIRQDPMGSGTGFIGIHAGVPGGPQITMLTMINDIISNYQGAGVLIEGKGTTATVSYSLIEGGGNRLIGTPAPVGIVIRDGALVTVDRSNIDDNRGAPGSGEGVGVLLLDADKAEITYNNVDRNDRGIHVVSSSKALIFRNGVDHSAGDGIVLEHSNENSVQRNRVVSSGGSGILLSVSHENTVYGNEVITSADGGLVLKTSTNNVVNSNRADGNIGFGMTDDSTGTKTSRTANTWKSDQCNGNSLGDSLPAGLCR